MQIIAALWPVWLFIAAVSIYVAVKNQTSRKQRMSAAADTHSDTDKAFFEGFEQMIIALVIAIGGVFFLLLAAAIKFNLIGS